MKRLASANGLPPCLHMYHIQAMRDYVDDSSSAITHANMRPMPEAYKSQAGLWRGKVYVGALHFSHFCRQGHRCAAVPGN